ncbi:MAG: transposase, partial [candidate division KSB1 bacterium]|nr:transposase [candidate division KSB1 bacterium]
MKRHLLRKKEAKEIFVEKMFHYIDKHNWELYEWVVLDNHYHLLVKIKHAKDVSVFINSLHRTSAYHIKKYLKLNVDRFWYQYWDRCIRDEKQFYETAMYIVYNPLKHEYVSNMSEYAFSSYQWNNYGDQEKYRTLFREYD